MPDRKRVESLVRYTVEGRLVEALETFYHEDGLAASIERQKMAKAAAMEIHEIKAASVLVEGNRAAIEWHAEWTLPNGTRVRVEEVALQTWKGDRIAHERFFYDMSPLIAAGIEPQ
jgi:hypothetical protein